MLLLLAGAAVAVAVTARTLGRPRRRGVLAWGCGGERLSPRMEYTATSYAEPLQRVFADVLRPEQVLTEVPTSAPYLVQGARFRQRLGDAVENAMYVPVLARVQAAGERARRLAPRSVHRSVGYAFAALLLVLALLSLWPEVLRSGAAPAGPAGPRPTSGQPW